jgi:hypothetical protein
MNLDSNIKIRYNKSKDENEVSCTGYFNSDFFTIDELIYRQKNIYNLIDENQKIKSEIRNDLAELYDITEKMRVELLKKN